MTTPAAVWQQRARDARAMAADYERAADRRRNRPGRPDDPWYAEMMRGFQAIADAWYAYADRCDEAAGSALADEHQKALANTVGVVDLAEQATRGAS